MDASPETDRYRQRCTRVVAADPSSPAADVLRCYSLADEAVAAWSGDADDWRGYLRMSNKLAGATLLLLGLPIEQQFWQADGGMAVPELHGAPPAAAVAAAAADVRPWTGSRAAGVARTRAAAHAASSEELGWVVEACATLHLLLKERGWGGALCMYTLLLPASEQARGVEAALRVPAPRRAAAAARLASLGVDLSVDDVLFVLRSLRAGQQSISAVGLVVRGPSALWDGAALARVAGAELEALIALRPAHANAYQKLASMSYVEVEGVCGARVGYAAAVRGLAAPGLGHWARFRLTMAATKHVGYGALGERFTVAQIQPWVKRTRELLDASYTWTPRSTFKYWDQSMQREERKFEGDDDT